VQAATPPLPQVAKIGTHIILPIRGSHQFIFYAKPNNVSMCANQLIDSLLDRVCGEGESKFLIVRVTPRLKEIIAVVFGLACTSVVVV